MAELSALLWASDSCPSRSDVCQSYRSADTDISLIVGTAAKLHCSEKSDSYPDSMVGCRRALRIEVGQDQVIKDQRKRRCCSFTTLNSWQRTDRLLPTL